MPHHDRYGLPLTTGSATAADAFVDGVDRILALQAGAQQSLAAAAAADEGFAMAHAAMAFDHDLEGRPEEAQAAIARARAHLGGANRRERQHVEVLSAALHGEGRALELVDEHLEEFPRDALVLFEGMLLRAFGGGEHPQEAVLAHYRRVAAQYGDDWWFLAELAFALHEVGLLGPAWPLAERALDFHPGNGAAAHSLTHLHYESGDHAGGVRFLQDWLTGYDPRSPYASHFSWHRALHHLALDDVASAWESYEASMRPSVSDAATTLADASSLLWRVELYGLGSGGERWTEVNGLAARRGAQPGFPFRDVHVGLAHAGAGDATALAGLVESLRRLAAAGDTAAGCLSLPLVEGIAAFSRGDHAAAIDRLEPVLAEVVRLGGSRAQREVIEDTLLVAHLRANRAGPAAVLLRRRLDRRPSPRDSAWLAAAEAQPPAEPGRS